MTRRRADDRPGADFTSHRRGLSRLNGHTKWVVGVVGSLLVAGFMYLVKADREEIGRQIHDNTTARITMQASVAVLQASLIEVKQQQHEIKEQNAEILREVRKVARNQ